MVMDPGVELCGLIDEFRFGDHHLPSQNFTSNFRSQSQEPYLSNNQYVPVPDTFTGDPISVESTPPPPPSLPPSYSVQGDSSSVFLENEPDITLSYISMILLEEDMEEKFYMPQGESALQAAEKPFLEILREKNPLSIDCHITPKVHMNGLDDPVDSNSNNGSSITRVIDGYCVSNSIEPLEISHGHSISIDNPSPSSFSTCNSCLKEPKPSADVVTDTLSESLPIWQFNKGVEEASKFLPDNSQLVIDLESNVPSLCSHYSKEKESLIETKTDPEKVQTTDSRTRGRKISYHEDILDTEDRRSIKQSAVSTSNEENIRSKLFDDVLLCPRGDKCKDAISRLREILKTEVSKKAINSTSKGGSNSGKSRGKRNVKKEVVDLRTLLIHCAQSVAADDCRNANDLLKQIRHHSSSYGDGSQRLAQVFADGLEARLAGTGSQMYHKFMAKKQSATDILKAYHLYLAACPFKKISHFFANRTILNAADKASTLHIIDFGIYFGFQWPCLIQMLASRAGGPPKLRITGIDVPQPGFRPNERIEETGRRLKDYAQSFKVPFEYHPIATKWENIQIEDLKISNDEVLVVNCLYRFRNLVDETVVVDSPRNVVLNNIRKMNPDVFIHGVVNGAYSAPFFVTRFREALFHFSSLFDVLETTVPREHAERLLIEREIFGREAMNVIACEGFERVERPEIYKQWQVRNLRAGFTQLPLNKDIMKKARDKVESCYHKDFVIDFDGKWLLQGWKGRIIYAISTWRPSVSGF